MLTRSCKVSNRKNETRKANLLPIEILVLQGFLSLKDVSHLDIAICDVDLRLLYLNSLQCVKIRDNTEFGRGDDFVTWVIKRQIKLLNFKEKNGTFTRISTDKIAIADGEMKLGAMEDFQLNNYSYINFHDDAVIMIAECCLRLRKFHLSE
jgi:hypothetical protein